MNRDIIAICHYALGLSFLALILLSSRLLESSREIHFLRLVLHTWLPSELDLNTPEAKGGALPDRNRLILGSLRTDVEQYIVEVGSARTTLLLSVVFVVIYIMSWWWMAFTLKQARQDGTVPLRTVLLLSIFAAVDIAASTGFVLLRLIMYAMRDRLYPQMLRAPYLTEADQFAAVAALRLATLKSSTAIVDILVSSIIGFLTGVRVYSVVSVISFYKRAKQEASDNGIIVNPSEYDTSNPSGDFFSERFEKVKELEEYVPKTGPFFMAREMMNNKNNKPSSLHAAAFTSSTHHLMGARRPASVACPNSIAGDPLFDDSKQLTIQAADMPADMQRAAVSSALQAFKLYSSEKHIAESIKQDFDQMYSPTWHCVVGKKWGSCVTHSKKCYVRMSYRDMTVLLYRSI